MRTTIRSATAADVAQILIFIRALAVYERAPDAVTATEERLLRDGFGPRPFYRCLMAEHEGKPAGFAFYFFNYSTWKGRPGIYLEDLFVEPAFRGLGIGRALLEAVAADALQEGCDRLQWEVLDWNTQAIDFYRAMGAEFLDEWRNVRLEGEALARLARRTRAQAIGDGDAAAPGESRASPAHTFARHGFAGGEAEDADAQRSVPPSGEPSVPAGESAP